MAAMKVKGPPHCGQAAMSIAKTRLSNCAQLMRVRVEAVGESLVSFRGLTSEVPQPTRNNEATGWPDPRKMGRSDPSRGIHSRISDGGVCRLTVLST